MDRHNRDIAPSVATRDVYRLVQPLVSNRIVDTAFAAREEAANRARERYHLFGRAGMVCVLLGAIFVLAEALVLKRVSLATSIAIGIVAGVGLALQLVLIATRQKQRWLNNRFAAERLRSIKFQAYVLALKAATPDDLQAQVDAFYMREIALLENELNAARSVLKTFSPARALARLPTVADAANPAMAAEAADAYAELRIRYQERFAADETEKLQSALRVDYAIADILYLIGASFSVAGLIWTLRFQDEHTWLNRIEFVAVTAFILGLSKTLMDNASLGEESRMRYVDYQEAIAAAQDRDDTLPVRIAKVERAALQELRQFCQAANRISYRL